MSIFLQYLLNIFKNLCSPKPYSLEKQYLFSQTGLCFLMLMAGILLNGCRETQNTTQVVVEMKNEMLVCEIEVISMANYEFKFLFKVLNQGHQPVSVEYFEPYVDFDLRAYLVDEEIPVIQPAYDTGVQLVNLTIEADDYVEIATPIRLRFDPDIGPSGGDESTVWSLQHVPTPVLLQFTMRLNNITVPPCEVHLDEDSFS